MVINIHAGHGPDGKIACGAVGLIRESTEARNVKDIVITLLRNLGHIVYDCTVDDGKNQSDVLQKIVKKTNANKADIDVSLHFNSGANDKGGNGKSTGVEVLLYKSNSKAKPYAERVLNAICALGFKNRGIKYRTDLYYLKKCSNPCMLVECCFVDDKDDVNLYKAQTMAQAIVNGIVGATNTTKPTQTNTTTTTTAPKPTVTTNKYVVGGVNYAYVFDPIYYADHNADLKAVFKYDATSLFNHFVNCGMKEGRIASANFNVKNYKNRYTDLQNAFGNNLALYYVHYCTNGRLENRNGK